ncbi:helicase SRCAP isoform X2 [Trichomycterus rosablanca]|uniref:helicase SRCAP isoform X2 n=1 Tax=Trichomycterus rosablanca TaxID=2290929 RepID=UPI002F351F34
MEQPKTNIQAPDQEKTTTVSQQNSNTMEPGQKSNLDFNTQAIQRQFISSPVGHSQNLSDKLSACEAEGLREQNVHYGCNIEKASLAHTDINMAEDIGTGHCQDRTSNPAVAGDIAVVGMERDSMAPENAYPEYKPETGKEEVCGTTHTSQQTTYIPPTQSSSTVSTACETTDQDHTQQIQTTTLMHSTQDSVLPESDVQQVEQQPLTAKSISPSSDIFSNVENVMDEPNKEVVAVTEESTISTKSDSKDLSAKQGQTLFGLPISSGNGNDNPNYTDEHDGYLPKSVQQPPIIAVSPANATFSQKTPGPSNQSKTTHATQENQLSQDCVNCTGSPKSLLTENKTGASGSLEIKSQSFDGHQFGSVADTEVCYDISIEEPKDGTCSQTVEAPDVTEGSHIVVCTSSDVIIQQNDCANSMQVALCQDHQLSDSFVLLHKNKPTNSEDLGLDSGQVNSDYLIPQEQESIPTEHKLQQIVCLNDVTVDEKQEEGLEASSGLHTVEVKDFIDVGILVQPGMEDTWLVVSESSTLLDGQSTEDTDMMDISTETMVHCPETQTSVSVYECTVPCFPAGDIDEDVKLLLTDKEMEDSVHKLAFEPLTETLNEEVNIISINQQTALTPQEVSPYQNNLIPVDNICMRTVVPNSTVCSNVKNAVTVLDPTPINNFSTVQEKLTEHKSDVSPVSLPAGVIDPKLLILKKGETPFLKHPQTLSVISKKQSPSVLSGTPSDGLDTVCIEGFSENDSALEIASEKAVFVPPTCSSLKDECLRESSLILESTECEDQNPQEKPLLDASVSTLDQNSPDLLRRSVSECGAITEQNQSTQCHAKQPCQDSMKLRGEVEVEEQHSPVQLLGKTKGVQHNSVGQLDASMEESSEGEGDSSLETQTNNSMVTSSPSQNKVHRWIAGRGTTGSTPSTSRTPSPPPTSSCSDWIQPYSDRALPSCSSPGKHTSQSSSGASQSDQSLYQRPRLEKHSDMAELAKHEAEIEHRTLALKREGFWSLKRLTRVAEPVRPKVHWDYLCEEMQWLSADFAQERRWKRGVARKVVRMVMRHHEEIRQKEERAKREEQAKLRRIASSIAKEVRTFWSSVEKLVQYKQQSRLEEKRKKALDLQLDFIVGQTERYSDLLSQSLQATPAASSVPSRPSQLNVADEDDIDFEPPCEEEDDEETIEVEEQQDGNDAETQRKEIELLKQESMLPLDELLSTLTLPQGSLTEEELSDDSCLAVEDDDKEFSANEEDSEDVEDTIAAQEVIEGDENHADELDDLAREGEISIEELLEKYTGAYASDFEEPSVSPEPSEDSDGTDDEEEEQTERDDSEDESAASSAENTDEEEVTEAEKSKEEDGDDDAGEGMEALLREGDQSPSSSTSQRPKKEISHIAATAESLQPKGYTLATTSVKTPIPFLLHGSLREYQHIGLDWLVTMYEKKLNGILADEMGLGKTIQTIAVLAHLACEKGNWGPHLIIVPTSVMLNWEMELKRWCPGFKILTYYGSQKERKLKRQGWTKPNAFHVCITSYKLVLQDHQAFRRKSWKYLILDEAQNIKNFKSQRWQSLLNFNSHRRLLLTGTPLQNSLMELWSLMHFLMPHVFQSHREFKEWFSNPLTGMIEGSQEYNEGLVKRLHKVLRPFLLRRIKADVEKQMPKKYEHVVRCRLSKRQRFLYDDFMAQASTKETLASGHFMSVINILMQLRKVCNHPNLFDPRPIHSPFIIRPIIYSTASLVLQASDKSPFQHCDISIFDLVNLEGCVSRYQADVYLPHRKVTRQLIQEIMESPEPPPRPKPVRMKVNRMLQPLPKSDGRLAGTENNPKPTCPVSPTVQPPRPPPNTEVCPAPAQPVPPVCPATPVATPRPSVSQSVSSAGAANPIMSVRPPPPSIAPAPLASTQPASNVVTQRVLLSPDMQARLPSGEVVSIAQLASLAGRPVSSSQGSKPVTFQLQGNKLTLSGAPPPPQPQAIQVPSSRVSGPGIVKIVVRQAPGKEGGQVPTLAVSPSLRVAAPQSVLLHPHGTPSPVLRLPTPQPPPQRPPVYTASPRASTATPSQPPPTRPVVKVQEEPTTSSDLAKVKASSGPEESSSNVTSHVGNQKPAASSQSNAVRCQRPRVQPPPRSPFHMSLLEDRLKAHRDDRISQIFRINELHCNSKPVYGKEVLDFLTFLPGPNPTPTRPILNTWSHSGYSSCLISQSQLKHDHQDSCKTLRKVIHSSEERLQMMSEILDRFTFVIPPVEAKPITMHCCHPPPSLSHQQTLVSAVLSAHLYPLMHLMHHIQCNMRTHFPDLRLIQYDCGKLQTLHLLLRKLKAEGHRVLIFTQMTRMLDILEQFLNYHGHIYLRLDGSTRVEQRQALMERFNADRRIFCFILSTRSGGVGVNLTGADTVVFYDSDWNPTMDAQAQDRCHRIGQTRDVHIYRLISERTVEENILKKANQKRMLGDMAIEGGNFTTAFFKEQTIRELFDVSEAEKKETEALAPQLDEEESVNKQQTNILEQALCRAEDEEDIVAASQAKAEQVAELAEFNENIPLDDGESRDPEEEELSKAEQEIAALVEQLTPIERYAMNFLEASLQDICKEELKQAEEQVEAARKGLDQAKEEGLKLHQSDNDDEDSVPHSPEEHHPARRTRKHKEKGAPSTRVSGRLRGTPAKLDDLPATHQSPEREKGRKKESPISETSASHAPGSSSRCKSPQPREVPERQRSTLRGRGANKEQVTSATPPQTEHKKPQTDQQPSDSETSVSPKQVFGSKPTLAPSQNQHPVSPSLVPSAAAFATVEKSPSGTSANKREAGAQSDTSQQGVRERKASLSSDSVCSPEPQPEQNSQHSPIFSMASPQSRSPRKRQSADGEVLKNLPEDSPSAKVLRKLPGRLVTVVEDKEPKRRRRGESGSGGVHTEGSSEETEQAEFTQDATPCSPDRQSQSVKDNFLPKSPSRSPSQVQPGQEQVSPSSRSPGRSYHPYSPTHHSPDMPVLRNLPVRRRLETESRMAAQLGEQFLGRGRGHDRRTPLSPKKQEPNSSKDDTATPNVVSCSSATSTTPLKRKRGRPPRIQPTTPEATEHNTSVAQKQKSESPQSPPLSPKRKRGRPRKTLSPNIGSGKSGEGVSSPTNLSIPSSEESVLPVQPTVLPSESPVVNSPAIASSASSKAVDLHQQPKTDSENQLTTPISPSSPPCDSCIMQTSTSKLPSENASLKVSALECNSQAVSPTALPQDLQTSNFSQTNTELSLQPDTTPRSTPDQQPTSSIKSVSQGSSVTTAPSNDQAKDSPMQSNQSEAPPKVPTIPAESSSQPSLENSATEDSSIKASVSPVKSPTMPDEPTSEPINTTVQPLLIDNLTSPFVAPSNMMQNTSNSSQPKTVPASSQPAETALTDSSQTLTSKTSPESPKMTTEVSQPLPAVCPKTSSIQFPAEQPETKNQQEPRGSTESSLIKNTEEMEVEDSGKFEQLEKNNSQSQGKKRKMENLQEDKMFEELTVLETEMPTTSESDRADKSLEEESVTEGQKRKNECRKQSISRQSSQESVCSSSPSSVSSCNTRSSWSKNAEESGVPAKRKRVERDSKKASADRETDEEPVTPARKQCSNSSSSFSDSEDSAVQERRLTRSSQKVLEKESKCDKDNEHKKGRRKSGKKVAAEEESTGATPVRLTRKSLQLSAPTSPEPEVLSKRCSALNAAAKLLAMRGRGPDSPSSSGKGKMSQEQQMASVKNIKPKGKTEVDFPKTNSSDKISSGQQSFSRLTDSPTAPGVGHSPARSTRQRPGNLVTPLDTETKKLKKEEKKNTLEVEDEKRETRSSRGHSACSSISSERGAGSSRSRSSSNSSQCTRSLSSRSTGRLYSRSRAPSSGSDTERGKGKLKKTGESRGRESRKGRHSHKHDKPELSAGSSEGTPDRVLRSVAALAVAQARPPSSNTRSSASHHRQTKT